MPDGVSFAFAEWWTTITFQRPGWIPRGGTSSAVFSATPAGGAGLGAGATRGGRGAGGGGSGGSWRTGCRVASGGSGGGR